MFFPPPQVRAGAEECLRSFSEEMRVFCAKLALCLPGAPVGFDTGFPKGGGKQRGKVENLLGKPGCALWKTMWKMWITLRKPRYRVVLCKSNGGDSRNGMLSNVDIFRWFALFCGEINTKGFSRFPNAGRESNFFRRLAPGGPGAIRRVLRAAPPAAGLWNAFPGRDAS